MTSFLSEEEQKISNQFEKEGFIIADIKDKESLKKIEKIFIKSIKKIIKSVNNLDNKSIFNLIHKKIKSGQLNNFRLKIINEINRNKDFRKLYYKVSKPYVDILVGNELSMQRKINLSIQLPRDKSSLLPIHSDVWSGDSPFEMVVWLPLVDCYKTKAMYILPPKKYQKMKKILANKKMKSSKILFKKIKKDLKWIKINYGQILMFNQCLPHGNVINEEKETRWSLNCRFKGVFTPYKDKKIGEFFEPISLRKISQIAIKYNLPKIS
jgi:sporadic carbohydrate cluster 2OG-Fe(II) oxygenase